MPFAFLPHTKAPPKTTPPVIADPASDFGTSNSDRIAELRHASPLVESESDYPWTPAPPTGSKDEIHARAVAVIRKYDAELHGRRVASAATWQTIQQALADLSVFGDAYANNDTWWDYKRRAAHFADFETALQVWLHGSVVRAAEIELAYDFARRDVFPLFRIKTPMALRAEADALEDDYSFIERITSFPEDVEKVVDRLRKFADGDVTGAWTPM